MGRRRRRVIRIVKKKLPTVFICPRCGEEAVRVTIAKDSGHAVVLCALCNLRDEFPAHPAAQPIDVYSYFTDRFYGVKEPRAIIPREREIQPTLTEEPMAEEELAAPKPPIEEQTDKVPQSELRVGESKPEDENFELKAGQPETPETLEEESPEENAPKVEELPGEAPAREAPEAEKESEEDNEPFADILENKDKKRYSSQPLPQQSTEHTN